MWGEFGRADTGDGQISQEVYGDDCKCFRSIVNHRMTVKRQTGYRPVPRVQLKEKL